MVIWLAALPRVSLNYPTPKQRSLKSPLVIPSGTATATLAHMALPPDNAALTLAIAEQPEDFLEDPSPRPELQGTPPNNDVTHSWAESTRAAAEATAGRAARPPNPQPAHGLVALPLPPALARYRAWANFALAVSVIAHVAAAVAITWMVFRNRRSRAPDVPSPDQGAETESSVGGLNLAMVIMVKSALVCFGGDRLLRRGLLSLELLFGRQRWAPRQILGNGRIVSRSLLLGYGALPFATSAMLPAIMGVAVCAPTRNINNYMPVRTRDDIKAILEAWYTSASALFQCGMGIQRAYKRPITPRHFVVFTLSVGVAATAELAMGMCKYNMLMWSIWFPLLGTCAAAWFVDNAKDLLGVRRLEDLCRVHVDLLLFLIVLYMVRWSPLDEYCQNPICG